MVGTLLRSRFPDGATVTVTREADARVICADVRVASGFMSRLAGLLPVAELDLEQGLLLQPCNSVHTLFMRFSIDVVFLDERARVLRIYRSLRPWRASAMVSRAVAALELSAGVATDRQLVCGDVLSVGLA